MTGRGGTALAVIWGGTALLVALVVALAWQHQRDERAKAYRVASETLETYLQSSVAALNRHLLNVDLVLAAQSATVRAATGADGSVDAPALRSKWRELVGQHLLVRDLVLVDAEGRVHAAVQEATARLGPSLPPGFLGEVLGQRIATLRASAPQVNEATGEPSIWLARVLSDDWRRRVLLAEIPLPTLTGLFVPGNLPADWVVTVERDDGVLLASLPPQDAWLGRTLAPRLRLDADGRAHESPARIDGEIAMLAVRPSLYPGVVVTVGLPVAAIDAVYAEEHRTDNAITLAAVAILIGLAALIHWHLHGERRARAAIEQARERLAASHADLLRQVRARESADAARQRAQHLIERVLSSTQEGYWHIDTHGRTVDVNPAMCALLGRTRDEVIGRTIYEFVDAENARIFRDQIALREKGMTGSYEIALLRGDGTRVACINSATPIYDEHGQRIASVGLWTNVDEIKQAQRVLAETQATLDRALDSMDEGFIVVDARERVVIWNRRYLEIFPHLAAVLREGVPLTEVKAAAARHMRPQGTEAEREAWIAERASHVGSGRPFETVLPDGRTIAIIEHRTGDAGFVAIYRDVTTERAAQRELASAKATLEQALDAMSDGFVVFDDLERLVAWNRRYTELFPYLDGVLSPGMTLDEVGEIATRALLPDASEAERTAFRANRRRERMNGTGAGAMAIPGGRIVEAIDRRTADGLLVSVFRDVTRAREAAKAMEEARNAAEAAARAKSQFLAAMSHEIRTPLNAVLGMNGLLMNTPLTVEQRKYVDLIGKSGESLLAIINDILDLSRLESGKLTLESVEFPLVAAVNDVVSMMTPRAQARGITIDFDPGNDPLVIRGDPSRLRQVLFNLIGNAIKFTERGGVVVGVAHADRGAERTAITITVRDTGIGIAPEAMGRLFERFSQADNSTSRRFGGTGLGLAISREIVALMGGRIDVTSTPGVGSEFRIELELERAVAERQGVHFAHEGDRVARPCLRHERHEGRLGRRREIIDLGCIDNDPIRRWGELLDEASTERYALIRTDLRDLVWAPAQLTFSNGGETVALLPVRYAGTYGPGATSLAINGALLISGAAAGMTPSTHFTLDAAAPQASMHVRRLAWWTAELSPAELIAMTTA